MDQFDMQQALKIAKNREQTQQGATVASFILACVFAYYSPDWLWFHGTGAAWYNIAIFLVIMAVPMGMLWWLIDRTTVDKRP